MCIAFAQIKLFVRLHHYYEAPHLLFSTVIGIILVWLALIFSLLTPLHLCRASLSPKRLSTALEPPGEVEFWDGVKLGGVELSQTHPKHILVRT
jgi:hypothetical protein